MMKNVHKGLVFGALTLTITLGASTSSWAFDKTERVSVGPGDVQGNSYSSISWFQPFTVSRDGRFVAFESGASNLVPGDTNDTDDVFVRDRKTNTTTLVSVGMGGAQGNELSLVQAISGGGRFVGFFSRASNLVPNDTNDVADLFIRDRRTSTTERVSVGTSGAQSNGHSIGLAISVGGRFVAFASNATNLVPGDVNKASDVFVRDRKKGITEQVSVSASAVSGNRGSSAPGISASGRYVAFSSSATNLVAGDTNHTDDVFVRDRELGTTERVSISSASRQSNGHSIGAALSADGRFIAFHSTSSDLVSGDTNGTTDVFVRDRELGTTERVSLGKDGTQGNGLSLFPAISADGRFVAFLSAASNLVSGDTNRDFDTFVRDRQTDTTVRVSVSSSGLQAKGTIGQGSSGAPAISADGRVIAFPSWASNLVPRDTNHLSDIFVRVLAR